MELGQTITIKHKNKSYTGEVVENDKKELYLKYTISVVVNNNTKNTFRYLKLDSII